MGLLQPRDQPRTAEIKTMPSEPVHNRSRPIPSECTGSKNNYIESRSPDPKQTCQINYANRYNYNLIVAVEHQIYGSRAISYLTANADDCAWHHDGHHRRTAHGAPWCTIAKYIRSKMKLR
jgi:hypothetical protein